jgi:hypothetical protein
MCRHRQEKQEVNDGRDEKLHRGEFSSLALSQPAPFGESGKKLVESGGGSTLSR